MLNSHELRHNFLWLWTFLATFALALAGLFAGLIVLSKAPITSEIVPWPNNFFQKGLVAHVSLSFIVWFLTVFGALNISIVPHTKTGISKHIEKISFAFASIGTLGILIPAFSSYGEPTLNNYIPIIIDPIYYWGLTLLLLGILSSFFRVLLDLPKNIDEMPFELPTLLSAGLLFFIAIIALGVAALKLDGRPVNHDFNENLAWGSGHILQIFNTALFALAASILFRHSFSENISSLVLQKVTCLMLLLVGCIGFIFLFLFELGSPKYFTAFTNIQYLLGIPVATIIVTIICGLWKQRSKLTARNPSTLSLISGLFLFSIGVLFGLFVDGTDTRTPAHYHAIIGGINVMLVGLFYIWFLPLIGRALKNETILIVQIAVYSLGQLVFVVGMFVTGSMGASRKIMGAGIDLDNLYAFVAITLKDVGGVLAILGGIIFVFIVLKALFTGAIGMQ